MSTERIAELRRLRASEVAKARRKRDRAAMLNNEARRAEDRARSLRLEIENLGGRVRS